MRLKDIQVGERYDVQIPERVDRFINEHAVRGEIEAVAVEVGVRYTVESYRGSAIRGAGVTRRYESANADGVLVRWEAQEVPGRYRSGKVSIPAGEGIVVARNVQPIPAWR